MVEHVMHVIFNYYRSLTRSAWLEEMEEEERNGKEREGEKMRNKKKEDQS